MERLCIVFGGRSSEHEVSLMSAAAVIRACNKSKYELLAVAIDRDGAWYLTKAAPEQIEKGEWRNGAERFDIGILKAEADFVFPVLHGSFGEDGTLQGLLEMMDIPYAGCGVLASALCMDKGAAKDVFVRNNIPTCGHMVFRAADIHEDAAAAADEVAVTFDGDVFIKPANAGSSIGIGRARGVAEIVRALKEAARFDRRVIVEAAIDGREMEVAVIGNSRPEAGEIGEIIHSGSYYDYDSKYSDNAGTKLVIPADVPQAAREKIRDTAVRAYKAADCCGFARVDFFVERTTGKVYINEINTIPGFTKYSMFPLLMEAAGVSFSETIDKIVEAGHERYNDKNNRQALCGR